MNIFDRINPILLEREEQLRRNEAALRGGKAYINLRLWRAPNESDISWLGGNVVNGTFHKDKYGTVGRKERACIVNDAGRIASKIDQYLFSKAIQRSGINEDWARSVTSDGRSINEFWLDVSDALTAGQWCWLQADRGAGAVDPLTGERRLQSLAEREAAGDVVTWKLWSSRDVIDWSFDKNGRLLWLLTVEKTFDNSDPYTPAVEVYTRTLWRRGTDGRGASFEVWQQKNKTDAKAEVIARGTVSSIEVPFVLVGHPSTQPWWFDDIEMMQAQCMNIDSLHVENLQKTVFPQIVIPSSMYDNLETRLIERSGNSDSESVVEIAKELVRGLDTPLVESSEDKGTTRFISGANTDLTPLPTELLRKRQILFDQAGLALFNKESRQVQTVESKQFDHLDTEATLRYRAGVLQIAEKKLVDITLAIDSTFAAYEPIWPDEFNVVDVAADVQALAQLQQLNLTLTQRKLVLKATTRLLDSMVRMTDEERQLINGEIDEQKEETFDFWGNSQKPNEDDTDNNGEEDN